MLKTRIIPCLLLKDFGLVKTVNFKNEKYIGDPINAVKIFNDKEVDELIFLDIDASAKGRKPDLSLLERIASESFMPFAYGGGIRDINDIDKILRIGIEKVAIGSSAIKNPELIRKAVSRFGGQSIIVVLNVKKNISGNYEIFLERGTIPTGLDPAVFAKKVQELGAGEIMINSIDKDGLMSGYDLGLIKTISNSVKIPIIACGGAGIIRHFKEAIEAGASAVSGGSIFLFWGPHRAVLINYPEKQELEKAIT